MATVGLYGSSSSGVVAAASGSESIGLYGNGTSFGGSYFEWFIFQVADTQPATPTGGSWDFNTNTGTPPTGWSSTPPANPTNIVWVSIALVNSKNVDNLTWSAPGKFSYSSGLPILSGSGTPGSGVGQSDQLYIQLDTTPQTIWFKESGTWTRLTGSTLYVDTTSNQTIAGTKTFSSQIQGSVSGTAANVTGIVAVANGGTGVTTSTGSGNVVLSNSPTLSAPTISNYEAFTPSTAPTYAEGLTWYDSASNALSYYNSTTNNAVHIGQEIQQQVRNSTGSTITKGQVVYISGSTGQIGNVILAQANAYVSSQVIGVANQDIPNNTNGWIVTQGTVSNINTSGFTAGNPLYLSATTAGAMTQTEPSTPNYSVHMGVCLYSNVNNGKIYICPINRSIDTGYIIGQVAVAQGGTGVSTSTGSGSVVLSNSPTLVTPALGTPVSGNFSTGTFTWPTFNQNTTGTASNVTGIVAIANGGTGQTTANAAFNALAPSQVGNSGKYLTTDGTNTSWATNPLGTVTSVDVSGGTTGLTTSGGPITTSGTITLAGTLGITNGGTGATTAAGAATNLGLGIGNSPTFTGLTLSGGTANGVAYLNGSKVVTTGSALTFDGTNLATTGSVILNNAQYFYGKTSGGSSIRLLGINSGDTAYVGAIDAGPTSTIFNASSTSAFAAFYASGSEQMRLTSTGLGIGTSSPSRKLTVASETAGLPTLGTGSGGLFLSSNNGLYGLYGGVNGSTGDTWLQAMRNDSALAYNIVLNPVGGNLGLGVTPSAWGAGRKAIQVGAYGALATNSNALYLNNNAYTNGTSWIYQNTDYATQYQSVNGQHQWFTAPSGTAGNAISFTQAMTLDASGNLAIGTTSASAKLHVVGTDQTNNLIVGGASTFYVYPDSVNRYVTLGSSGNLSGGFKFNVGNTETARIDLNGSLLVGTTSGVATGVTLNPNSGAATIQVGHQNGTANGSSYMLYYYNSTQIGSITQSGTTAVLYNVTSDQRLKENIQDADSASALIDSLQVRKYDWKADGTHQRYGFVAQELVTVAPEAVHQPADPEQMMAVDYSKLVPMLVKEIQSLRARVAQLEGN